MAIYRNGLEGERPLLPLTYDALLDQAREVLSPEAFGYLAGGAGEEDTMRENRDAFHRWRIVPRMLRGVADPELSTEVLGTRIRAPFLLAPVAAQGILHPEGELAVARAAADSRIPIVLSTLSSSTIEDVAGVSGPAPRWFQLYWPSDPELTASLLQRARSAGYTAIVLTLDTFHLAWRPRDLANAYLPFLRGDGLANYFSDPVFRESLEAPPEEDPRPAIRRFAKVFNDPSRTWEDLARLREATDLPIVLKGILHPDDARRATEWEIDAVIVSNHGGRQVDGSIAALDALPTVVEAAGEALTILFDSGVRTGADAFKALALGARAVLIGRPYACALAVAGETGVRELLENLVAELDLTMGLSGCPSLEEVGPECLVRVES